MNDASMNSHLAQSCRDGNRLMTKCPSLTREVVLLHWKCSNSIEGAPSLILQRANDMARRCVYGVVGLVKLLIGDRSDRLSVHAAQEADDSPGVRKKLNNICFFVRRSPGRRSTRTRRHQRRFRS